MRKQTRGKSSFRRKIRKGLRRSRGKKMAKTYRKSRRTIFRRKYRFRRRRGGRRIRGRGTVNAGGKISKRFLFKIKNTEIPWQKFNVRFQDSIYCVNGNVASTAYTIGTMYKGPEAEFGHNNGLKYDTFNINGDGSQTDLAYAVDNLFSTVGSTLQTGTKGLISSLKYSFRIRNNQNIRANIMVTYFIPRKGAAIQSYKCAQDMISSQLVQTATDINYAGIGFDWRQHPVVVNLYRLVVKRFSLAPGESRNLSLYCGGLPFFGSNNYFDEAVNSKRFTRYMEIRATGDPVQETNTFQGELIVSAAKVTTGPVNLLIMAKKTLIGKDLPDTRRYLTKDISGTPQHFSSGVGMVPIGGTTFVKAAPLN